MELFLSPEACRLLINQRVYLLSAATLRTLLGCTSEAINKKVEAGKLLWVFNFSFSRSAKGPRLDGLRFWAHELADPNGSRQLSIGEVTKEIVGTLRTKFEPGEVCLRLNIDKTKLGSIRHAMGLPLGDIRRDDLMEFLKSRWLGNN